MIDVLLVPTDGSNESLRAVDVAADLCRRAGVPMSAVVVDAPNVDAYPDVVWLREHVDPKAVQVQDRLVVTHEEPLDGLLEVLEEQPGARAVMSSHGRSGVGRALLGSVSEALVRRSRTPVLLVGPEVHPAERSDTTIVLCTHRDPPAPGLLDAVVEWSSLLRGAPVAVACVQEDGPASAARAVDLAVAVLASKGVPVTGTVLSADGEDTATVLRRHALEVGAVLLVAEAPGTGGVGGLLGGGVSTTLVRRGERPVLLVGPAAA